MKNQEKNNQILTQARKEIRNGKIMVTLGVILTLTILILSIIGILPLIALIFVFMVGHLTYIQLDALWMKEAMFDLQRYIFEDGFKESYDRKHNINQ
jgi:hypothetical protein